MAKELTEITFDFEIGESLYNKPPENYGTFPSHSGLVRYTVVSRIYEEIGASGDGVVSYVVRHNDPATPGGGKLFKFAQEELVNTQAYDTLISIKRKSEIYTEGQTANKAYIMGAGISTSTNPFSGGLHP